MENNVRKKCWLWFPIAFTKYEIIKNRDDYELIITSGLIAHHEEKIKIFKINDVTYDRTFGNVLCGVGNIILNTSDSSSKRVYISKIRNYKEFGKVLEDLAYEERKRVDIKYTETNVLR